MTTLKRELQREEVMRYYDHELTPAERARVENALAREPVARAEVQKLLRTSEALSTWAHEKGQGVDVADLVLARLDSQRSPRRISLGAISGLALAAVVALSLGVSGGQVVLQGMEEPQDSGFLGETDLESASIQQVDFGVGTGTIFMVSSGTSTTPVVWLAEGEEGVETGAESL